MIAKPTVTPLQTSRGWLSWGVIWAAAAARESVRAERIWPGGFDSRFFG